MEPRLASNVRLVGARHGAFFLLTSDTIVSRSVQAYGEWTESEIEIIRQLVKPGDNVIDVGANLGCHTVPIAKIVAPQGTVLAFEPQPRIFQLLASNVLVNGLENVRLFPMACASQPGTILFPEKDYSTRENFGATSVEHLQLDERGRSRIAKVGQSVPLGRIDDVFDLDHLKLLKIDVEGMEADVILGGKRTIENYRPILFVENELPERSEALLRLISSLNYDIYWQIAFFFSPRNFRGETRNLFGRGFCVNNLCLPSEWKLKIKKLKRVDDFAAHPRKKS